MNQTYYPPATTAGQTTTSIGLGLPTTILGIPTWVWIVGGVVVWLAHKKL